MDFVEEKHIFICRCCGDEFGDIKDWFNHLIDRHKYQLFEEAFHDEHKRLFVQDAEADD